MPVMEIKFGARINFLEKDVILLTQTKSIGGDKHVLDLCGKVPRQMYVSPGPNQIRDLTAALQLAKLGDLPPKQQSKKAG